MQATMLKTMILLLLFCIFCPPIQVVVSCNHPKRASLLCTNTKHLSFVFWVYCISKKLLVEVNQFFFYFLKYLFFFMSFLFEYFSLNYTMFLQFICNWDESFIIYVFFSFISAPPPLFCFISKFIRFWHKFDFKEIYLFFMSLHLILPISPLQYSLIYCQHSFYLSFKKFFFLYQVIKILWKI